MRTAILSILRASKWRPDTVQGKASSRPRLHESIAPERIQNEEPRLQGFSLREWHGLSLDRRLYEHQRTVLCLVLLSATWIVAQSTDSGNAGWGPGHAGTAGQSTTPGQTTSPGNTNPPSGTTAPTPRNCQSRPWNRSQHQRLYTATAERHAGARHNLTGVGNCWGYHPATSAQQPATKQSVTKPWHQWEAVRATFEVVESRARSSVQGVPLFGPNNGTPAQAAE